MINEVSKSTGTYRFIQKDMDNTNDSIHSTITIDVMSSDPKFLDIIEVSTPTLKIGGGSNYKEKYDNAISNLAYTTVYYEESEMDGNSYCSITHITGGYLNNDPTCKVISQNLSFGQTANSTTYSTNKTPSSKSWSYTAPSTWKPVKVNMAVGCYIGSIYTLQIQRYSTPWTLELENYIVNSPGAIWP